MSSYFDNYAPWKNIKTETIDGQVMVKIPKFYVKYGTVNGRPTWWVSDVATTGFEVYPAFLRQGKEMDCFYMGAYASTQASPATSVAGNSATGNWQNLVNSCATRGTDWHCANVYERMAIALLMMIEMGGPDMQTLLGTGTEVHYGASSNYGSTSNWRGMYSLYGHNLEAVTGIYTNNNTIQVWDKNGYCNKITTRATADPLVGFTSDFASDKGGTSGTNTEYDLNYIMLSISASASDTPTGDYVWYRNGTDYICCFGGIHSDGYYCGVFFFNLTVDATYSSDRLGVRLARYGSYSS